MWQENLCALSTVESEAVTARRAAALIGVQEFFVQFAAKIVELQKLTLRDVVMSNEANKSQEWMNALNFFRRDYVFLTLEDKELLEDWEFVLCDMLTLEPVAFLPRLKRCFMRVDLFITERAEVIKKLACKNLETALGRKQMLQFPMSTFSQIFLERYKGKLEIEQMEAVSMWEENLCALSTVEREAVTARRRAALISVQEFFSEFAGKIVELQKQTLRDVVTTDQTNKSGAWMNARNFFRRDYVFLTLEDKESCTFLRESCWTFRAQHIVLTELHVSRRFHDEDPAASRIPFSVPTFNFWMCSGSVGHFCGLSLRQWMNRYTMLSFDWCHVSFLIMRQTMSYLVTVPSIAAWPCPTGCAPDDDFASAGWTALRKQWWRPTQIRLDSTSNVLQGFGQHQLVWRWIFWSFRI